MAAGRRTTYLLKMCELVVRNGIEQHLRNFSVTGLQYTILSTASRGHKFSVADLARACRVTPQSMSDLVAALEQKSLITRDIDLANKRVQRISITDAGHELLASCDREMDILERQLFDCLTENELSAFRDYLIRVVAHSDAAINFEHR